MIEKFKKYARKESSEMLCLNESVLADPPIALHTHDFIELSYVTKGCATHIVNGNKVSINAGDLFLLANDCQHTFEKGSSDFSYMNVLFLPQLFGADSQYCSTLNQLFSLPYFENKIGFPDYNVPYIHLYQTNKSFGNLLSDGLLEYYNAKQGYLDICKNILEIILLRIARCYLQQTPTEKKTSRQELIDAVYDYMKPSSSFKKIRREDIAGRINIHPDSLSRIFKKEVGVNLSEFIRDIRLQYAACYLLTTTMNVREIIHYVGYQDSKNFYKAFEEKHNMTPAEYRKTYKGTCIVESFSDESFDLKNLP